MNILKMETQEYSENIDEKKEAKKPWGCFYAVGISAVVICAVISDAIYDRYDQIQLIRENRESPLQQSISEHIKDLILMKEGIPVHDGMVGRKKRISIETTNNEIIVSSKTIGEDGYWKENKETLTKPDRSILHVKSECFIPNIHNGEIIYQFNISNKSVSEINLQGLVDEEKKEILINQFSSANQKKYPYSFYISYKSLKNGSNYIFSEERVAKLITETALSKAPKKAEKNGVSYTIKIDPTILQQVASAVLWIKHKKEKDHSAKEELDAAREKAKLLRKKQNAYSSDD